MQLKSKRHMHLSLSPALHSLHENVKTLSSSHDLTSRTSIIERRPSISHDLCLQSSECVTWRTWYTARSVVLWRNRGWNTGWNSRPASGWPRCCLCRCVKTCRSLIQSCTSKGAKRSIGYDACAEQRGSRLNLTPFVL